MVNVKGLTECLFWSLVEGNTSEIQISIFCVEICSFASFGIYFLNLIPGLPFIKDRSFAPT